LFCKASSHFTRPAPVVKGFRGGQGGCGGGALGQNLTQNGSASEEERMPQPAPRPPKVRQSRTYLPTATTGRAPVRRSGRNRLRTPRAATLARKSLEAKGFLLSIGSAMQIPGCSSTKPEARPMSFAWTERERGPQRIGPQLQPLAPPAWEQHPMQPERLARCRPGVGATTQTQKPVSVQVSS
jgi:hypothetical protein